MRGRKQEYLLGNKKSDETNRSQGAHNLFLMSQEGVVADIEEIDTLKAKST